jgi:chromosome segregation ATPase
MARKTALIVAGTLTIVILVALVMLSISSDVRANQEPVQPPTELVRTEIDEQQKNDFEAALVEREAELQNQLVQRQEMIKAMDERYESQFAIPEEKLIEINSQLTNASNRVEALKDEYEQIQGEITAADKAFQEEMTELQNSMSHQDSQIRQEIELVYAQLQQAYEQIAIQEASAMSGGASSDSHNGSSTNDHDDDDHDDHDDDDDHDDHHNDDHDNDHDDDHDED